jgi:tRNA modification GTPase
MREGLNKIVQTDETIAAIATPLGRSAIGLIRISGRDALKVTKKLFQSPQPLQHRRQVVGTWMDSGGDSLDEVVIAFAKAPHSYTGEDLVEIGAHGNPVILSRLLESIRACGVRLAAPGEFTLRAVANGKMDLLQAEAVRAFIEAQTEHQARTALRQMEGAGGKKIMPVKQQLVEVIAHLEAGIDFAEDDVEIPDGKQIGDRIDSIIGELVTLKDTFGYGRLISEGLNLAILGKPNVGKSSLFNRLLLLDRAIVTDTPGTTRDVLTEGLNLDGIPLRLMDTAGLRETSDQVERMGVGKSLEALAEADLALVVFDGAQLLDDDDERVLNRTSEIPHLLVVNKVDLPQAIQFPTNGHRAIHVSARTGFGMETLRAEIKTFLQRRTSPDDEFILTNQRQYETVTRSVEFLATAKTACREDVPHEMVLLDLYSALSALNELTGEVVTEDILDRIFSTFCIGK